MKNGGGVGWGEKRKGNREGEKSKGREGREGEGRERQ